MALHFTEIPSDTFDNLQLNAGVVLTSFTPATPTLTKSNIVCATTGGITVTATPTFKDYGDDVDNCPKNTKELKHIESWDASIAFTSLGVTADVIKLALGAATKDSGGSSVTPNAELASSDFADSIWWVGDLADGKFVAVELKNALSTAGLSLKSTDKGKGQLGITLTGHYSINAVSTVPVKFYLGTAT